MPKGLPLRREVFEMDQRQNKTRKVNVVNPDDYRSMYLDGSYFREYAERKGYVEPRRDPQAERDDSEDLTKSEKPKKNLTLKSIFDHPVLDTRLISRVDHRRDRRTKNKKGPQKQKEKWSTVDHFLSTKKSRVDQLLSAQKVGFCFPRRSPKVNTFFHYH